jgi:hypothetical protein
MWCWLGTPQLERVTLFAKPTRAAQVSMRPRRRRRRRRRRYQLLYESHNAWWEDLELH